MKVCATHAGITVGEDGASHQSVEDIALMRAMPNMKVFNPCDAKQAEMIVKAVADIEGPCYVRLGRGNVEDVYQDDTAFTYGKGNVLRKGKKVAIVATGMMVQEALSAYETLKAEGKEVTVVDMPCIKPIDEELIKELAKEHEVIVSCEEHSVIGGLGSAIAEVLAPCKLCKQIMIGVKDSFGESGKPAQLFEKYGIDAASIRNVIQSL